MRRSGRWIGVVGMSSAALLWALQAHGQQAQAPAPEKAKEQQAQPPTPQKGQETLAQPSPATAADKPAAFAFKDDAQMQEFGKLWQQRQAVITRMAVLQAYWDQEQGNLTQVNQQLLSQYNLDVNKNYALDTNRKVLVEQEAPAAPAPGAQPQAQKQPAATPPK